MERDQILYHAVSTVAYRRTVWIRAIPLRVYKSLIKEDSW
jgi:hypothetical protein